MLPLIWLYMDFSSFVKNKTILNNVKAVIGIWRLVLFLQDLRILWQKVLFEDSLQRGAGQSEQYQYSCSTIRLWT